MHDRSATGDDDEAPDPIDYLILDALIRERIEEEEAKRQSDRAELERIGAELGFGFGSSRSCPHCGGIMIHTRLRGMVCATRGCGP